MKGGKATTGGSQARISLLPEKIGSDRHRKNQIEHCFSLLRPEKSSDPAILNAGFRCSGQEKAAVDIIQMAGVVAFF
jgi:hypothetical protein